MGGEDGEVEDQEDETVFSAVVGEGEGGESGNRDMLVARQRKSGIRGGKLVSVKGFLDDGQRAARLLLRCLQSLGLDILL